MEYIIIKKERRLEKANKKKTPKNK